MRDHPLPHSCCADSVSLFAARGARCPGWPSNSHVLPPNSASASDGAAAPNPGFSCAAPTPPRWTHCAAIGAAPPRARPALSWPCRGRAAALRQRGPRDNAAFPTRVGVATPAVTFAYWFTPIAAKGCRRVCLRQRGACCSLAHHFTSPKRLVGPPWGVYWSSFCARRRPSRPRARGAWRSAAPAALRLRAAPRCSARRLRRGGRASADALQRGGVPPPPFRRAPGRGTALAPRRPARGSRPRAAWDGRRSAVCVCVCVCSSHAVRPPPRR